ncbi:MAG: tetratricopeptide repeat protein [Bacteroidales bacterium]|jgi:tetratricopeptide (TPR) repeat protein|nr:tetratricopeptide repeat protein [Bacteroidales bacterium]
MLRKFLFILALSFVVVSCSVNKKTSSNVKSKQYYETNATLIQATTEKEIGNTDKAIELYKKVLSQDKDNAIAHYYLGDIYFGQLNFDKAVEENKLAIEKDNKTIWYPLQLAQMYTIMKDYKKAADVYEKVIKQEPDVLQYYQMLSTLYHKDKNYQKELETLSNIEKKWGISEDVSMYKFNIYKEMGNTKKAEQEINNLQKAFPNQSKYYSIIAEMAMKAKDYDKALLNYKKVEQVDSNNQYINIALANYYIVTNNSDSVYLYLQKTAKQKDLDFKTKIQIIYSVYEKDVDTDSITFERFFSLLKILSVVNEDQQQVWSLLNTGYVRKSDMKNAAMAARKSISLGNKDYEIYQSLLYAQSVFDTPDSIIKTASEVIELFPTQPFPYLLKGINLFFNKDYKNSITILEEGVNYAGNDTSMLEDFYANLGQDYYDTGKDSLAFMYFDKTLKINPNNYLVLNNYAYYLALKKMKLDMALDYSKRVVEKYPDNPTFIDTYAWILYLKGEYSLAKQWMEKVANEKSQWSEEQKQHYKKILEKN